MTGDQGGQCSMHLWGPADEFAAMAVYLSADRRRYRFLRRYSTGLGGGTTLSLMLPFVYTTYDPQEALSFSPRDALRVRHNRRYHLCSLWYSREAASVATIIDGYPMTKKVRPEGHWGCAHEFPR